MPVDGGGNGRVTIATVAARAGRSISTVSAALNGSDGVAASTREEIVRIAAELGYQADPRARSLRRRHTGLIGAGFAVGQAFQGLLVEDNVNNPADRNENGEGKICGYMPKCFFRWPQAV